MAWITKQCAIVTSLGYTICIECAEGREGTPVYADTYPTCEDKCEGCQRVVAEVTGRERVRSP